MVICFGFGNHQIRLDQNTLNCLFYNLHSPYPPWLVVNLYFGVLHPFTHYLKTWKGNFRWWPRLGYQWAVKINSVTAVAWGAIYGHQWGQRHNIYNFMAHFYNIWDLAGHQRLLNIKCAWLKQVFMTKTRILLCLIKYLRAPQSSKIQLYSKTRLSLLLRQIYPSLLNGIPVPRSI